jgi:hypothetical protein
MPTPGRLRPNDRNPIGRTELRDAASKVPAVTLGFWVIKVLTTPNRRIPISTIGNNPRGVARAQYRARTKCPNTAFDPTRTLWKRYLLRT